jgi:DNA-binding MarR family transcriptional regulator
LLDHVRERYKAEFPREITQAGIAKVLRTRRSHVSTTLSSLRKKGYVEDELGRIENGSRRKRVYFLTYRGYMRAKELRYHYLAKKITVVWNHSLRRMRIMDLNGLMGERRSLVEVLNFINDAGVLNLDSLQGRSVVGIDGEPSMEHEREDLKSDSRGAIALYLLIQA